MSLIKEAILTSSRSLSDDERQEMIMRSREQAITRALEELLTSEQAYNDFVKAVKLNSQRGSKTCSLCTFSLREPRVFSDNDGYEHKLINMLRHGNLIQRMQAWLDENESDVENGFRFKVFYHPVKNSGGNFRLTVSWDQSKFKFADEIMQADTNFRPSYPRGRGRGRGGHGRGGHGRGRGRFNNTRRHQRELNEDDNDIEELDA